MVSRTFVHIGLPKTATTYLQTIFWANRDHLRAAGLVVPGAERRDHLWSSREVREDPHHAKASAYQRGAWQRVLSELRSATGTGLVSHEFFAAASAQQAQAMVQQLPGEVEVVVTARDLNRQIPATWQERVQNGTTASLREYGDVVRATRRSAPSNGAEHPHAALGTAFWRHQSLDRLVGNWIKEVG